MPKITIPNPLTDGESKLRVTFKPHFPPVFNGLDEELMNNPWDEDEANIDIEIRKIEEGIGDEYFDVSAEWEHSEYLEDIEEEVKMLYIERQRERYADRLAVFS